jgi:hypothetical protein
VASGDLTATTLTATVPSTYLVQQGEISITVAEVASGDVPTSAQTLPVPPVLRFLSRRPSAPAPPDSR